MSRSKVLYIDDDAGISRLIQKTLEARGFEVVTAPTGTEGLELLTSTRFDIVALDHHMPGHTGLEILRSIRALSNAPPVVYVTGSEDSHIAVTALKSGAVDYVWKDVQGHFRELLAKAILTALDQEKLRREKEAADNEVRLARDRAELLLKEVNHRVANSLAIVAGLVGLQRNSIRDPSARDLLARVQGRIIAIASVHRRLYTSPDVRSVDVCDYLVGLVEDLKAAMTDEGRSHPIRLDCVKVLLPTDKAVSLGIITTELVTNAYKYAYPEGREGEIRIILTAEGGRGLLAVEDDGVGLEAQASTGGTGLGSKVIASMALNLGGELKFAKVARGTRATLSFPL
ncbi:response regulator [Hyphomicrobium sp.]|uniref:response regulator n=1 Tax=Hyphomicrobium sp. TaxID=82 RepID=UPI000F946B0E|nr:response regulator [Hyphomicrobium sp.]RUP08054.1 MAG: response regulator [Hyphomicrobium sp.]